VERDRLLPLPVKEGDVIIGLPSSGIHSNGYSLVHKIISNNNIDLKKESLGDNKLIKLLLEPTRIYTKEVQTITKRTNTLKAVAHITGGGLTENLPRVISEKFSSEILLSDYPTTPLYSWIKHNSQLEDKELMRTFNCGIGLVMVFDSGKFEDTRNILESENIPFALIGKVIKKEREPVIYCGKLNL
jgi:Phosphoribosylaminoimidazole (AIR) synthetase